MAQISTGFPSLGQDCFTCLGTRSSIRGIWPLPMTNSTQIIAQLNSDVSSSTPFHRFLAQVCVLNNATEKFRKNDKNSLKDV